MIYRSMKLFLILTTFWMQSLIAPGYMPSFHNGRISIIVCSIEGIKNINILKSDVLPDTNNGDHQTIDNDACPFSLITNLNIKNISTNDFLGILREPIRFHDYYAYITFAKRVTAHGQRAPPTFIL